MKRARPASGKPANGKMLPRIPGESARHACADLLGLEPSRIEYPGGRSRTSVRAIAGDKSFIVTRRRHAARAALEAGVLGELHAAGAPVPKVLAFDGAWLIQEDLGQRRLTSVLDGTNLRAIGDRVARAAGAG